MIHTKCKVKFHLVLIVWIPALKTHKYSLLAASRNSNRSTADNSTYINSFSQLISKAYNISLFSPSTPPPFFFSPSLIIHFQVPSNGISNLCFGLVQRIHRLLKHPSLWDFLQRFASLPTLYGCALQNLCSTFGLRSQNNTERERNQNHETFFHVFVTYLK